MSSFILYAVPKEKVKLDEIVEKAKQLSIYDSQQNFKSGIFPETITKTDYAVSFEFGFEYSFEYPTLDGVKKAKSVNKVPIIITKQVIAVGNCEKEIESRVLSFIEKNFIKGVSLERVKFDEKGLREVINKAPEILQAGLSPKRKGLERIDKISFIGRRIEESDIWRDYGEEPLVHVKVRVPELPEEPRVGFRKSGVLTIYNRFSTDKILLTLRYLIENIISNFIVLKSFQYKLEGGLWDEVS